MGRIIIVSNRLPVRIEEINGTLELKPTEGGLATGLGTIYRQNDNLWLGWPGLVLEDEELRAQASDKLSDMNLCPVFLSQDDITNFYEGFSNEIIWPLFHYHPGFAKYEQQYWNSYKEVNHKFKNALLKLVKPDDIVWIHDYQLLLLPGLLRAEMPDLVIGFFQHIPFPSSEIFRLIPWRAELLENMLGADLIGFHTFDDVRHFLSATTRLLPVHSLSNVLTYNGRKIVIESFPMGIDDRKYETLPEKESVREQIQALKLSYADSKIILSIDRLDYSKGILQRLEAFDLFLQDHPEYIGKILLYMIVVPSRDTVQQYKDLRDTIDKTVGNINSRYRTLNWTPVHYYYRSEPQDLLSALYNQAEVCLITPLRDGMNLVSKEYVASRTGNNGVLILSEMAGAAKELIDAVIVNPNNTQEISNAILTALTMPIAEQERRMKRLRSVVSKFNIRHWVKIYMDRLNEVKTMQQSMKARSLIVETREQLEKEYAEASKRIILLDYDGTLVGFHSEIDMAFPDDELYEILRELSLDEANDVVIISGRKHETLEEWFSKVPLDIIAEHGAWMKNHGEAWTQLPGLYNHWKNDIRPVLERYIDRTPGSFIEEKDFALVFHYRKVEEGLGDLRANELMEDLRLITADKSLQILPGNKVVEVKNIEVNKGKVALRYMDGKHYDFVMAIGDDHTDEDIFRTLPPEAHSIKIGSNISAARFYLKDFKEARRLLRGLTMLHHD